MNENENKLRDVLLSKQPLLTNVATSRRSGWMGYVIVLDALESRDDEILRER